MWYYAPDKLRQALITKGHIRYVEPHTAGPDHEESEWRCGSRDDRENELRGAYLTLVSLFRVGGETTLLEQIAANTYECGSGCKIARSNGTGPDGWFWKQREGPGFRSIANCDLLVGQPYADVLHEYDEVSWDETGVRQSRRVGRSASGILYDILFPSLDTLVMGYDPLLPFRTGSSEPSLLRLLAPRSLCLSGCVAPYRPPFPLPGKLTV